MEDVKYCTKCGEKNTIDAIYCLKCGSILVKDISNESKDRQNYNESIKPWKFFLFSFISFGLYSLYWMYKTWKILRDRNNKDVSPFWRTFFSPIFVGSLARESFEFAEQKGYPKNDDYFIIGAIYFITNIFDIGANKIALVQDLPYTYFLLTYIPSLIMIGILIPIVKSINRVLETDYPNLSEKKLTWWQILLIIVGCIITVLALIP